MIILFLLLIPLLPLSASQGEKSLERHKTRDFKDATVLLRRKQCQAINVGFELYIGIESKLSISIVGFDLELGEFCHDFHSISIPINHSGTHFNLPAISTSLK